MSAARMLIVNADDFGQSAGVNRGIVRAHSRGIVTSTSLMVRWPAAREAAELARSHPALAVGLHLDFGEWSLRAGEWVPQYGVVPLDDAAAVEAELARQIEAFAALTHRAPTHLDSHQHVHLRRPAADIVERTARALGVPLRHRSRTIRYCGDFYGQAEDGAPCPERIGVEALLDILARLPTGITELACHPAAARDLDTMYAAERVRELETLCDRRVRAAIERLGIELCSFADFAPQPH